MKRLLLASLFLCFLDTLSIIAFADSHGQALTAEELLFMEIPIVSVSRRQETLSTAPGIVSVITAKEIKDFGANSLFDILNRAPSIQMLGSNAWVQNLCSMRGDLDTHIDTRILLLLNGRPIRDGTMGGWNFPVYTTFPVDTIERIEIIRGPGSVLYGSNAFVGVINIITKESREDSLNFSASTGLGSFKAARETLNMWYAKNGFKFNVGAQYFNEEGWNYKAKDRYGIYDEIKFGEENTGVTTNLSYTPNEGNTEFKFTAYYARHTNDMFGILPYWSQKGHTEGTTFMGDIGLVQKIIEGWAINAHITNNYNDMHLEYPATSTDYKATELNNDWLYEVYISGSLFDKLNIIGGGLAEHRYRPTNQINSAFGTYHQEHYTVYTQGDYKLTEKLTLMGGVQVINPDAGRKDVVNRAGAVYNINNKWGTKLLYGEAYRSPYPAEQLSDIPVLQGNPDLKPEQIATTDWQLFRHTNTSNYALTLFNSRYTDVITRTGITYINGGGYEINGIELEGKKNVNNNLSIEGSAMYKDEVDNLILSPDLMVKLGLSYTTGSGLTIGLFDTFFGAPRTVSAPVINPKATSVSLVDFNLNYKLPIKRSMVVNLYVKNLLDQDYNFVEFNKKIMMTTLPQQSGRAFYCKVSVEF